MSSAFCTRPWTVRVPASSSFFLFCAEAGDQQAAVRTSSRSERKRRLLLVVFVLLVFLVFVFVVLFVVIVIEVFVVLVLLVAGVRTQLQRGDTADTQIRAALFAHERIAFVEFFFIDIHYRVALWTIHHSCLLGRPSRPSRGAQTRALWTQCGWICSLSESSFTTRTMTESLRRLQNSSRALQIGRGNRDQGLFEVFPGFDHLRKMVGRQFQAPGVRERVSRFLTERKQIGMHECDHLLMLRLAFGPHYELDVHGIGMTNRDPRLEPPEFHFPRAAEWIRSGAETTAAVWHFYRLPKSP